jgi:hypothetical protein
MELKLNDIYKFQYNEKYCKQLFEPYHCFDGQLIVRQGNAGDLYLEDTYWSSGGNKTFTLDQALVKGILEFICNIEEIEKIGESEMNYYANEDLFDLSKQHHCYNEYYKRKGAKKCPVKMERVLIRKIEKIEHNISWENSQLIRVKEDLGKLRNGDIDIYI